MAVWVVVSVAGCASTQESDAPSDTVSGLDEGVEAYQHRVNQLHDLWADGVVEWRWQDDSGSHSAQGDLEAWVTDGDRTALRVSKLGEVLLWLGSNRTQRWAFDLTSDPSTLRTHAAGASARSWVEPLDLRRLLGIEPLPLGDSAPIVVEGDAIITSDRRRVIIDVHTGVATTIELLDDDGSPWARATHRPRSIRQVTSPGTPLSQRPHMAFAIDIEVIGGTDLVKMSFEEISTDLTDQPLAAVFDLERLTASLQPERRLTSPPRQGDTP